MTTTRSGRCRPGDCPATFAGGTRISEHAWFRTTKWRGSLAAVLQYRNPGSYRECCVLTRIADKRRPLCVNRWRCKRDAGYALKRPGTWPWRLHARHHALYANVDGA
nr:hypothetical protein CFP56_22210 [Quercus suber]